MRVISGTANVALAKAIAAAAAVALTPCELARFPDGEVRPAVSELRGDDVYLVQPTGPPTDRHLVELLLMLDACRRAGAGRLTALLPYFGYARQDRRSRPGEALGARVVATALAAAGADRLVVVDPHTPALEAMGDLPIEMVTAVPVLAGYVGGTTRDPLVVAPDLGAVKLAQRYAALLHGEVAVVQKVRTSAETVEARRVIGDVQGRHVLIVDDMISTGATIVAAGEALIAAGCEPEITVVATHGPLIPAADQRIRSSLVSRLVVTDTVAQPSDPSYEVCSVADLLADVAGRLHRDEPLGELLC